MVCLVQRELARNNIRKRVVADMYSNRGSSVWIGWFVAGQEYQPQVVKPKVNIG
jgi:hypothetical protein